MISWLTPKKAAQYLKEKNPDTMIGEGTLRKLAKSGFPCLKIDSMTLINVDTFEEDLNKFVRDKAAGEEIPQVKKVVFKEEDPIIDTQTCKIKVRLKKTQRGKSRKETKNGHLASS